MKVSIKDKQLAEKTSAKKLIEWKGEVHTQVNTTIFSTAISRELW
jgi:hypothetical protein